MVLLMYRTLLDLVEVMEETSRDCQRCGPKLWNYAQDVWTCFLDELAKACFWAFKDKHIGRTN